MEPISAHHEQTVAALREMFGGAIEEVREFRGEVTIVVALDRITDVCRFLKEDARFRFELLADLHGIDMYTPARRFGVNYNLYSYTRKERLRLRTFTEEAHPAVPSVTGIWRTANWHERETYDMFGIQFTGHPDLRRMYMPEDYEHFPLRKDFPLMGIPGSLQLPKKLE